MMESHAGRYEGEGFHDYRLSMEDYSTLVTINRDPRTRRAVAALQETLAPGHGVTELQRAFESRDVSRDGFLTRAHMHSAMPQLSPEVLDDVLHIASKDDVGRTNYRELLDLARSLQDVDALNSELLATEMQLMDGAQATRWVDPMAPGGVSADVVKDKQLFQQPLDQPLLSLQAGAAAPGGEAEEKAGWGLYMGAAVGATAAGMGGYVFGYTSPILTNDCNGVDAFALNCELVLSESVKAVLTSLSLIGGLAGSLLGGPVADRLGRRAGLTVGACCMALGWLLIILCTIGTSRGSSHQAASSLGGGSEGGTALVQDTPVNTLGVTMLLAGRLLTGVGMGASTGPRSPKLLACASPLHNISLAQA